MSAIKAGQLRVGDTIRADTHDGAHVVAEVRESFWPDCSVYGFTDGCSAYAVPHDLPHLHFEIDA